MKEEQRERIEQHGRNLLAVFPDATEKDPVKLCKKLRRLEKAAHDLAERGCNGPEWASEEEQDSAYDAILDKVNMLLLFHNNMLPVFINRDPRGYALKVSSIWQAQQKAAHQPYIGQEDWGGYGIIAPDIN